MERIKETERIKEIKDLIATLTEELHELYEKNPDPVRVAIYENYGTPDLNDEIIDIIMKLLFEKHAKESNCTHGVQKCKKIMEGTGKEDIEGTREEDKNTCIDCGVVFDLYDINGRSDPILVKSIELYIGRKGIGPKDKFQEGWTIVTIDNNYPWRINEYDGYETLEGRNLDTNLEDNGRGEEDAQAVLD